MLKKMQRLSKSLRLTGVPSPVAASHPTTAGNPVVLQPVAAPCVTSRSPDFAEYSHGFRNPSGGFFCAISASLSRATIAANAGAEPLVPSMRCAVSL